MTVTALLTHLHEFLDLVGLNVLHWRELSDSYSGKEDLLGCRIG